MRIASWNVESIRAHERQVLDWIASNDVDVACLQETKAGARKFPRNGFASLGYELVVHGGDDGRGGVAMASRSSSAAVDDVVLGIPGAVAPLDEPRSITATVSVAGSDLRLHTAYAPNGRKVGTRPHEIKLAWFALFAAWMRIDRDEHPQQLVAADLNIAPTDLDVWEPSRYRRRNLTSPPERAAFAQLLDDGLVDVVREAFGEATVFTWWNRRSDFYATDRGWRLDHLLATEETAARVTEVAVDRAERGRNGSCDHAPLIVELAPAASSATD